MSRCQEGSHGEQFFPPWVFLCQTSIVFGFAISQVHDIKYVSARRINGLRGRGGPVWQHQFWDRFVRHRNELRERFDYMHFNPVRRGLVMRPEEWRWSSWGNFALEESERRPIQIDYVSLADSYRG